MSSQLLDEQEVVRERECIHRLTGASGRFYTGESFIKALESLRGEAAMSLSRKVGPFFWSDASNIKVWLCADCAREASL
jgi:hypothetical protein